ncbi:MAG: putative Ig domain-containing protein [Actinoplanes sp.]
MPTKRVRRARSRPETPGGSAGKAPGDGGFTLVEVLVSIAVIVTVMAAVAPFLTESLMVSNQQRGRQVAIQVANDALERVRALDPSSLLTGRGEPETERQWSEAPGDVQDYLQAMRPASDPMLPATSTSGRTAPLPTMPYAITVNGVVYEQQWYVGLCGQAKALARPDPGELDLGDCTPAATAVPFFRVVVTVTWQHRACTDERCLYVASTLVSKGTDPVFDTKRAAPTVTDPIDPYGYVGTAVNLQLTSNDGRLPLTWSATGLPASLTISPSGLIAGVPTVAGLYLITATVTDRDKRTDDATFTLTVLAVPTLTKPVTQTSRTGTPLLPLPVRAAGGRSPLVWSATALPTGLAIDPATGVISGTPTTAQTMTTKVTITDAGSPARTASTSFSWRVLTPVQLDPLATVNVVQGDSAPGLTSTASGGLPKYTWKATNLPAGLTLDTTTGAVTGTVTNGTRYLTTITVTDSAAGKASITVLVNVTARDSTDVRVTAPDPAGPDRTTAVNTAMSVTATGGTPAYTWTVTGLPARVTKTASVTTVTPTAVGSYLVTVVAKDAAGKTSTLMFNWTVT